jgi:hypothetical protein
MGAGSMSLLHAGFNQKGNPMYINLPINSEQNATHIHGC